LPDCVETTRAAQSGLTAIRDAGVNPEIGSSAMNAQGGFPGGHSAGAEGPGGELNWRAGHQWHGVVRWSL
ncbi:MAG: hypothetical protein OXC91_15290, partial [Rhodobacteraceae bacterium]|nr:hypothetical protein [Paracoccaceae bacterium]